MEKVYTHLKPYNNNNNTTVRQNVNNTHNQINKNIMNLFFDNKNNNTVEH